MDDLVQWLGEQLDEDERIARAAPGPTWEHRQIRGDFDESVVFEDYVAVADLGRNVVVYSDVSAELLPFALRHDPARVLREIAAKRLLVRELLEYEAQYDRDRGCGHSADDFASGVPHKAMEILGLRLIASVYSDRPGYRAEWRP